MYKQIHKRHEHEETLMNERDAQRKGRQILTVMGNRPCDHQETILVWSTSGQGALIREGGRGEMVINVKEHYFCYISKKWF